MTAQGIGHHIMTYLEHRNAGDVEAQGLAAVGKIGRVICVEERAGWRETGLAAGNARDADALCLKRSHEVSRGGSVMAKLIRSIVIAGIRRRKIVEAASVTLDIAGDVRDAEGFYASGDEIQRRARIRKDIAVPGNIVFTDE